jgi:hypothetical protein
VLGWRLRSGSRVVVRGPELRLRSERRQECFKSAFLASSNTTCDYYSCVQCGSNWICAACALGPCHAGAGHTVRPFVMQVGRCFGIGDSFGLWFVLSLRPRPYRSPRGSIDAASLRTMQHQASHAACYCGKALRKQRCSCHLLRS